MRLNCRLVVGQRRGKLAQQQRQPHLEKGPALRVQLGVERTVDVFEVGHVVWGGQPVGQLVSVHVEDAHERKQIVGDKVRCGQNEQRVDGTAEQLEQLGALLDERIGEAKSELEDDAVVPVVGVDEADEEKFTVEEGDRSVMSRKVLLALHKK